MVSDPLGDFLIRIKNGYLAGKKEIQAPYSKIKEEVGKILERERYIKKIRISKSQTQNKSKRQNPKLKTIIVELLYKEGRRAIEEVRRVSKPGARVYVDSKHLPRVLSGYGTAIISTSRGLLTDKEARKEKLGGEVICKIW